MVYGEKPLKGVSEFVVRYGSRWYGSVKFGVMRISKEKELTVSDVPVFSVTALNHFVWADVLLCNNFSDKLVRTRYGKRDLDGLKQGG